jgi:hypothetical protein
MFVPRLMTARLIRLNAKAHVRLRRRMLVAAALGVMMTLAYTQRESVAQAIDWLRSHGYVWGGIAALASAIQVARHRALKRAEYSRSWLACVPVRRSAARWESLIIETFPVTAALGAITLLGLGCGLVLAWVHAGRSGALLAVWAILSASVVLGTLVGYAVPAPKPVDLPPGSRYVPHRKAHRAAKIRPSLAALGLWPVRQMFAWAQPKMVARTTIPILVMMPLGTTAAAALGAIAVFAMAGMLLLLCLAAVAASHAVRRWIAPLPVRARVLTRVFLLPIFAVMVAVSAVEAWLLMALGVSFRMSAAVGLVTAVIGCLAAFSGARFRDERPWGMP